MGPRSAVLGSSGSMRSRPLGPSVELPMGPRSAVLGRGDACDRGHWDIRWSSLWGHETCKECAKMGRHRHANCATGALEPPERDETCEGCAKIGRGCHASCATGTLVGAPYGATKRVRGVPRTACELRHWDLSWSSLWGHEMCEWCAEAETCGEQKQGGGGGGGGRRGEERRNAGRRLFWHTPHTFRGPIGSSN